jgi:hypothetical protein
MYPKEAIKTLFPKTYVITVLKWLTRLASYSIGVSTPGSKAMSEGVVLCPSLIG